VHNIWKKLLNTDISGWHGVLLLLVISALTYLPHVGGFSYYRDDWYYMLDGFTGGASIFHAMFSIDRPARGYLFEWIFQLFGLNPLPYHLTAYLWRILSGFSALWLFGQLWPAKKQVAFWMSLLFVIYPGYLWWVAGVEYQPMILSVCLQTVSIALTLATIQSNRTLTKVAFGTASVITGWIYIFLVDYAAGMEAMRYLCVYILIAHSHNELPFIRKIWRTLRISWVYILIPAGFLVWNLFFFQNQRAETDILLHMSSLIANPLYKGSWWLIRLFQSVTNTALFAWLIAFWQSFYNLRLKVLLVGLFIATLVLICLLVVGLITKTKNDLSGDEEEIQTIKTTSWQVEALWLGFWSTLFGVLPVVMANRTVVFDGYSHYALPASLSASILVIGFIYLLKGKFFQKCLLMSLVFLAVITHYSVGASALAEEQAVQQFWWQVSWRTSGLQPGTTLLVNYPGFYYGEDKDMVWGPANLIFAPQVDSSIPITNPITSVPQNFETTKKILAGGELSWEYRTQSGNLDFSKLLILSQPSVISCVHVMDERWPRLSISDSDQTLLLSEYSHIDTLILEGDPAKPLEMVFGEEPDHQWCYYYQKAELALQLENWHEVLRLADEADAQGFRPGDRVEWMPFIQAAIYLGDENRLAAYASMIYEERFLRTSACQTIRAMGTTSNPPLPENLALAQGFFCGD